MRRFGVAAVILAALVLTGCSGGASYSSPEGLLDAYVDAGGECEDPQEVGEDLLGEGTRGLLCPQPMAMLIVFNTAEYKDAYVAATSGSDMFSYGGERWIATSEEADVVSRLGGTEADR